MIMFLYVLALIFQMLPLPTEDKLMQSSMMSVLDSVSYAIDRVACEV